MESTTDRLRLALEDPQNPDKLTHLADEDTATLKAMSAHVAGIMRRHLEDGELGKAAIAALKHEIGEGGLEKLLANVANNLVTGLL